MVLLVTARALVAAGRDATDMNMTPDPGRPRPVRHILLLDDESSVVLALKLLLQALGFTVQDFTAPEEAVRWLEAGNSADLFICDLRMPKLTGMAVLERSVACAPGLPFVLMSAHATPAEVEQAKAKGAFAFLAKPFTPDELHAIVAEVHSRPVGAGDIAGA